jgi:hypothetical protein
MNVILCDTKPDELSVKGTYEQFSVVYGVSHET